MDLSFQVKIFVINVNNSYLSDQDLNNLRSTSSSMKKFIENLPIWTPRLNKLTVLPQLLKDAQRMREYSKSDFEIVSSLYFQGNSRFHVRNTYFCQSFRNCSLLDRIMKYHTTTTKKDV